MLEGELKGKVSVLVGSFVVGQAGQFAATLRINRPKHAPKDPRPNSITQQLLPPPPEHGVEAFAFDKDTRK